MLWSGHLLLRKKKEASTVCQQLACAPEMTPGFLFSNHLAVIMERSLVVLYDNLQVSLDQDIFFPSHLVTDTVAICRSLLPWLSSTAPGYRHVRTCTVLSSR